MIRKAQPKEGLETGGLISGSEAARARIAAEYEPDLSGANGPTARFDTLRELINTEIGAAQNEMTFASGDGSQIFGRGGRFAVVAPSGKRTKAEVESGVSAAPEERWDLVPDDGGYIVRDPLVMAFYGSASPLTIANDPVTLAANSWVVLAVNLAATPYTMSLARVAGETGGDLKAYTFDVTDSLTAARLPLHYISSTELPGAKQVGDFWALKYVSGTIQTLASHLVLVPERPISRPVPRLISL